MARIREIELSLSDIASTKDNYKDATVPALDYITLGLCMAKVIRKEPVAIYVRMVHGKYHTASLHDAAMLEFYNATGRFTILARVMN